VSPVAQPRVALRLPAAAAGALAMLGVALVPLVATLMGGLAPQGCAPTANFAPSAIALADIPGKLSRLDPRCGASLRPRLDRHRRDLLDRERLRPASTRPASASA
jgi:hypothetical protein